MALYRSPEAVGSGESREAAASKEDPVIVSLMLDYAAELDEHIAKYRYQLSSNGVSNTVKMCRDFSQEFFKVKVAGLRFRLVQVSGFFGLISC